MKTSVNLNGCGNLNGRGSESTEIFVKTQDVFTDLGDDLREVSTGLCGDLHHQAG